MFYTYTFFFISQVRVNFTAQQTDDAIEFFRNHPELYDISNRLYSDRVHKANLKKELAHLLHVEPWKIDNWYKSQRRELSQTSRKLDLTGGRGVEQLTYNQQQRYDRMGFMVKHLRSKRPRRDELRPVSVTLDEIVYNFHISLIEVVETL